MSAQTSYSSSMDKCYHGQIGDIGPSDIVSKCVQTAAIGFGIAVSRGTLDNQITKGGDNTFFGVTVRSLDREGTANTGAITYAVGETAAVMRKGYIWLTLTTNAAVGSDLHYTDTTGVIDAGTASTSETILAGATLETAVTSSQKLALVRLNY